MVGSECDAFGLHIVLQFSLTAVVAVVLLGRRLGVVFGVPVSRLIVSLELLLGCVARDVVAFEVLGRLLGHILGRVLGGNFMRVFKANTSN